LTPPTIGDRLREIEDHLITIEALAKPVDQTSLNRAERRQFLIGKHASAAIDELYWSIAHARVMSTPAPTDDQAAELRR
jgi:hypothetical protein